MGSPENSTRYPESQGAGRRKRPARRRRGVSRALLAYGIDNLRARGMALVDAFPWKVGADETKATNFYHGALSMFTAAGFTELATHENVTVVRKTLR